MIAQNKYDTFMGTSLMVQQLKEPVLQCRDAGLIPGQRTKKPHAKEQLTPRATTSESVSCKERSCKMQRGFWVPN